MRNKNNRIFATFVVLVVMAVLHLNTMAVQSTTITGDIITTYDDDDNVVGAFLQTEDGSQYNITLNDKGKELAADYDGKTVEVTGTVSEKDDENWLTVVSFKAATVTEDDDDDEFIDDEETWEDDDGGE